MTPSRLALLDVLDEIGGHRSADEMLRALRARGSPIPRATLYHMLETAVRAGLVLVADAGPGPALYESAVVWHHHLVCRSCGRIVDVPCVVGSKPCLTPGIPGAMVDEAQVIFRGLCPECAGVAAAGTRAT